MIEVLAPAGGFDSFEAAVRSGADAVYFGAGNFNARRNAKNFTLEDMRQAAAEAGVRGVKTYLTLNTLIENSELKAALEVALAAAEAGIDALIVQDLGLIRLIRRHLPNMPIHASTQMSVHSPEALPLLKEMGFSRVVVAREMDKEALRALCREAKRLGLEVEAFVHGALCMCLSGQCYLSSVLGGRSGNRGLCAQPCRLAFKVDGGTGHDLSLKDMSYIPHISEMAEMGVTSFKIEGRMKRPEYVAAAVTAVRSAADGKEASAEVTSLLSDLFSRSGHTDGYYNNRLGREMFGIRTERDVEMSAASINSAHELYRREYGRVALKSVFFANADTPILLTVSDCDGHSVTVEGPTPEAARSRETTAEFVTEKLKKCGGTPYIMESVDCEIGKALSIGGAVISALRNEALESLTQIRAKYDGHKALNNTVSEFSEHRHIPSVKTPETVVYFRNSTQIPDDLNGIAAVILPVETDFQKLHLPDGVSVLADIPRGILHSAEAVLKQLKAAKENGIRAAVCNNLAAFELAKKVGLPTVAGFGMNIYNTESVNAVAEMGAKAATLSFEMLLNDAVRCGGKVPTGIISYGRLPLMLFRNCPNKNGLGCKGCHGMAEMTDRKGVSFPVICRGEFSELYNSRPVWLFDRKAEMKGLDFEILMFSDEAPDRVASVLEKHRRNSSPDTEFTRGLYYREVL